MRGSTAGANILGDFSTERLTYKWFTVFRSAELFMNRQRQKFESCFTSSFFKLLYFFPFAGYISPVRWLMAVMVPLYISVCGYKRKSLNPSGAFAAYITGFFVMMSSYIFAACLIAFFLICSKATKVNSELKRKTEADFCEGKFLVAAGKQSNI